MAVVQPNLGDNVPDNVVELVEAIGLFIPDEMTSEEQEIYNRGVQGQCMTCGAELADTTMIVLNRAGVVMMYCGGACYSDMQVMGWLIEQHGDIVSAVKFRAGGADE